MNDPDFTPFPESEACDKFIAEAGKSVPEAAASRLRARLTAMLSRAASVPLAEGSEQSWTDCAQDAADKGEYQQRRALALLDLVCEGDANGNYVAPGLVRSRWDMFSGASARTFARGLLGLDGKPCPGGKDLSDNVKSELLQTATD